jgi:hypothetical protein
MDFENLYGKFNKFYEKIFSKYGLFISKYPIWIIMSSLIINIILSSGILKMKLIVETDELFMVSTSEAIKNEKFFKNLFNNSEYVHKEYYAHQLFDLGTGAEINFRVRDNPNSNILEKQYLNEILRLHEMILKNINPVYGNKTISFEDVCAKRNDKCWIEGVDVLNTNEFFNFLNESSAKLKKKSDDVLNSEVGEIDETIYMSKNGINFLGLILGKKFKFITDENDPFVIGGEQTYGYANILKIRYQMKYNLNANNIKVKLWEQEFLKFIKTINSTIVSFTYSTSRSQDEEMEANMGFDSRLITTTFILIMIFAIIFMPIGCNMVTSPGFILPTTGIFSTLFGISSSFGGLSLLGYSACNLIFIIPLLVLGKTLFCLIKSTIFY